MRRLSLVLLFVLIALPAGGAERWEMLPPTPAPIPAARSGNANVNGISIYYAVYGQGPPVILLHGGLANADYWGNQIKALMPRRTVIVMDSRGHGRSTRDTRPYGYDLMADDVEKNPTFAAFIKRAGDEYRAHSSTPNEYDAFVEQISKMWASEPNWTDAQLQAIAAPVLVVDGDHDEAIKREHTEYIAATVPHAGLLILPNASHFAFLQDPELFNFAVLHFLDEK